ncbi:MAG: hypothetical protein CMJ58_25930 [Planctomycetaceae bacterium]|nr:hypothetical protein [Planctomycetaceae bacterium]
MHIEPLIRRPAVEAQAQLDKLFAIGEPASGSALDQAGLRNGLEIIDDFLKNGEPGLALEHLVYMVTEPRLSLSMEARQDIETAAKKMGMLEAIRPFEP